MPDGTVTIESDAFQNAKHLTEVIFPDSVEEIGHSGFLNCENLRSIHLGHGLKKIDGAAFGACVSLTEIVIPDSVEEISYNVFGGCEKLASVVIGSGVVSMDRDVFARCDALREIIFRDPTGWEVSAMYSISSTNLDLSDPQKNVTYFTEEYVAYSWSKE